MGRLVDRFGIMLPLIFGSVMLGIGYVVAANTDVLLGLRGCPCAC